MVGPSAFAYYHFLRFPTRTGPFTSIPRRYDVGALPNRTLTYFVSEQGPTAMAPTDSVAGLISQIRLAAKTWSDIGTSELKLQFGGILSAGTQQAAPAIEVQFSDEIPPGVNALTSFQVNDVVSRPDETFVPIQRSVILLDRNLTNRPSFTDGFFQTMVHEFGHAIGLQHTFTASAMATEITRSTTKSKPLTADDIAGVSLLYPTRGYLATVGSISGRVAAGNTGMAMASVVAIPATGAAISTLTSPDGTYRIDGIPPGQYYVYVHPLPPARLDEATPGNIVLPVGPDARVLAASGSFETTFYPGTRDPQTTIAVTAGTVVEGVNFAVTRRNAPAIASVQAYSFIGQSAVRPPTINRSSGRGLWVATGTGLMTTPGTLTNGLTITPLGAAAGALSGAPRVYSLANAFVQVDLAFGAATTDGAKHLIFSANNDIYVLPAAYHLTSRPAPAITAVTAITDGTFGRVVAITGTNIDRDTTFLFDGQVAANRAWDETTGRVLVTPPPAVSGHRANVIAVNLDGQSSYLTQASNLPVYTYETAETPAFALSPSALPAGAETVVEVTAFGFNFYDGMAKLGFGSSDIFVRRVWVTAANKMLASVVVSSNATLGQTAVTLANGLQFAAQAGAFTIQAANRQQLALAPGVPVVAGAASLATVPPPNAIAVTVNNLPANATPGALTLTLNEQTIPVLAILGNQLYFTVPANTPPGPAVIRLRNGNDTALPFVIHIDPPPPSIGAIQSGGVTLDATRSVAKGDTLSLTVSGLVADAFTGIVNRDNVVITAGGVDHAPSSIAATATRGTYEVQFALKDAVSSGLIPLTVAQDGRVSANTNITVR